jgi:glycosyltransferase involved in cell wall biosynthesis
MISVTYFGNKINKYSKSNAAMETIEPLLREFCKIKTYSSKKNKFLRMSDMILNFFRRGLRSDYIIIDVFSTTNFYFAFILSILSILFKKKFILYLRGGNLPYRYEKSNKLVNIIFKNATHVIAPSHYLKSYFDSKGFKIKYIPNFIELWAYEFKFRPSIKPNLIYLRSFGNAYNPQMTVRTIALLKKNYPDIQLVMLGSDLDGTLKKVKILIEELNLTDNIKILGKMTRDEWVKISGDFDIMVSNPIVDNTPVSIIEGMALGLIIISTKVGGIVSLLNDKEDALLVDSNDHEGMANAIRQILENNTLALKLQENARRKAESFSWDHIKPLWEDLLIESGKKL